jgi:hypothetical protein
MKDLAFKHWLSAAVVILLAAVPPLADQYPNLVPSLLSLFPKHGQQWVPIAGVVLTVAAHVIRDAGMLDRVRALLSGGNSDGA